MMLADYAQLVEIRERWPIRVLGATLPSKLNRRLRRAENQSWFTEELRIHYIA